MRPISETASAAIEELAIEGAKQLRAYFAYQGANDNHKFQKARLGAAVISAYSRMIATETNREALRIAASRGPAVPILSEHR